MATRRLADVFTPELFDEAVLVENLTKLNVVQSGLVQRDPLLDDYARSDSSTGTINFDEDLGNEDPNIQSDDPAVTSTPLKTGTKQSKWIRNFWHQSWSAMTLARELHHSQQEALELIINRATNYWDRVYQRYVASIIVGLVADNIANNASDMVLDLAVGDGTAPAAANYLDANSLIESEATMGDSVGELSMIIINSQPYTRLRQLDLIDFESPAAQNTLFGLYQGKTVIVNDSDTLVGSDGTNAEYDTILAGQGLLGLGAGMPEIPSELEREPSRGNGGGEDILHFRNENVLHPYHFSYEGTPAGQSPTRTEFEAATSWTRTNARQNIPLVVVRANNAFVS